MAKRRRSSSLSKTLGKMSRKAITGSSASYKTQAKRKLRKAVTGSSLTPKTQAKRKLRKALTGTTRKSGCGCLVAALILGGVAAGVAIIPRWRLT